MFRNDAGFVKTLHQDDTVELSMVDYFYTYRAIYDTQTLANNMATRCKKGKFTKASKLKSNANLHPGSFFVTFLFFSKKIFSTSSFSKFLFF